MHRNKNISLFKIAHMGERLLKLLYLKAEKSLLLTKLRIEPLCPVANIHRRRNLKMQRNKPLKPFQFLLLTAITAFCLLGIPTPSHSEALAPKGFQEGVQAYREGNYASAYDRFYKLHKEHPENSGITYYLAMTQAQLGRFQQARGLYEEIVLLDPNSRAAELAKEGLRYLPPDNGTTLDLPPRFQASPTAPGQTFAGSPHGNPQPTMPSAPMGAGGYPPMSPEDMQAMQMMQMMMGNGMGDMGSMGGMGGMGGMGNMGGMNSMGMNGMGMNGMGGMDPNIMSTMMMNQMLQQMNLGGESPQR